MGTSSEDVLLMVNEVRHKKNDGTLFMMAERVAWMPEGKDTFSISHKYADIKMQKISPDGKPKVQLQVVLHSGDTTTFHFVNAMGIEQQLHDRNEVKEHLQQLLPRFKKKVDKDLEVKSKILKEDPDMYRLYRQLVVPEVMTSEEFWIRYGNPNKKTVPNHVHQDVGVSAAFLANINPESDGSNGIKYNITADTIESIFKTYPSVKRKHMENVPHKLSESEFWSKFFQSHYFHRDRTNHISSKDIFSDCAKIDEQEIKLAIKNKIIDHFVDINSFSDNVVDDIYKDNANPANDRPNNHAISNQSVIRSFNHQSMMVLQSCTSRKSQLLEQSNLPPKNETSPAKPNGVITLKNCLKSNHVPPQYDDTERITKRARLEEKTTYEDLQVDYGEVVPNLTLEKWDRYFHGPIPVTESDYISDEEVIASVELLNNSMEEWSPNLTEVLNPSAATVTLGELVPGGSLMKNLDGTLLKDSVPLEIQNELKDLYVVLAELLRHFWNCFPTTTPDLETKASNAYDTLERYQRRQVEPFQEKISRLHVPSNLAEHLMSLLEAAYKKYSAWQSRSCRLTLKS